MIRKNEAKIFDRIEVSGDQNLILVIKLIDLKQWQENEHAITEFQDYLMEMESSRASGVFSIMLWEDFWLSKPDVVKSRVLALLGTSQRIPGRLTKVRRIDKKTASTFLESNHLQGSVLTKTQYGLYLQQRYFRVLRPDFQVERNVDEMLVAVATFSHPRTFLLTGKSFRSFEMVRFANLLNTTVVGGLDKLLKAFQNDFKPGDIMTYADLEWSGGAGYGRLGFEKISDTGPFRFFLDPLKLERISIKRENENQMTHIELLNAGSRKFVKSFHDEQNDTKRSQDDGG
jgi:hypothetical protein